MYESMPCVYLACVGFWSRCWLWLSI